MQPERVLKILLRTGGTFLVAAFLAVVMPTSWMAASHARLEIGTFPEHPLTEYLTRSLSMMYGFHGVLLFVVSTNVRRFRPVVRFLGIKNLLFGTMILALDLWCGLPWWWTLNEGPPIAAVGLAVFVLSGRIRDEA
jgi:hypothetical protein